jgi:N-acetyl sugar amidotransferase
MDQNVVVCSRCLMDSTVRGIRFDANGICNFCQMHDALEKKYPLSPDGEKQFHGLIQEIKQSGRNQEYDCIVGVSGGRDSTYTLAIAKKMGLKPLAVHFDNGWNSEMATRNIHNAVKKLDVDLFTHVASWEEFKDIQVAFLKASVPDVEVPTDFAIISVLYNVAREHGIRNILIGHSFRTEGIAPREWTYMDARYIRAIHRMFGTKLLTSVPLLTMSQLVYYTIIKKMRFIHVPEMIRYEQAEVNEVLEKELGWQYYGGHHHESIYTEFIQSYLLPKKFGIDKRRLEYSALVRSGQMERADALMALQKQYPVRPDLLPYVLKKLDLSREEFDAILALPPKSFHDYPSYFPLMKLLRYPIRLACFCDLLPQVMYEKFFS